MSKYDVDLEKFFKDLGITSYDIDYLKEIINQEINRLAEAIDKKKSEMISNLETQFQNLNNEIIISTEQLNDTTIQDDTKNLVSIKIKELNEALKKINEDIENKKANADTQKNKILKEFENVKEISDPYKALKIIATFKVNALLTPSNVKKLSPEKLEECRAVRKILTENKDLREYLDSNRFITQYVDIKNADQSALAYKEQENSNSNKKNATYNKNKRVSKNNPLPMYDYNIKVGRKTEMGWTLDPVLLFEDELKDKKMQIYDFGKFEYRYFPKKDGKYMYTSNGNSLIGIVKEDENGNLQTYHGVIDMEIEDPEFYINVPFSDMMMKNAEENNFGYIGHVSDNPNPDAKYKHYLDFKDENLGEIVTALSYAMTHNGKSNVVRKNLKEVYEAIDELMIQKYNNKDIHVELKETKETSETTPDGRD